MGRRTAAIGAALIMSTGAVAATADAAGGPPLPTGVGGATVKQFATGVKTPTSFAFGHGTVFEGDGGNTQNGPPNGGVNVLRGGTATAIAGSPMFVGGLAWQKNALYVSGGVVTGPTSATWTIQKWTGWNGTKFSHQKVIWTAPKGLDGLNGVAFGPDGRLYVGVDTGLIDGNDHGPASTSPDLYKILSMQANGKGLKVFAKGIRQPWQFAFPKGSPSPLVSDLGQDADATNPPDFILKPKAGDNFGFPKCNHTVASKCKGFAKPFKTFGPHTDPMGMAIIGKTLYFTSFLGPHGAGPGGEVFSMPVRGGAVKPVVKGFVAPIVGLGVHGGKLYVGATSGQVYAVKP